MKKILVPIDFSADSINALELAVSFANVIDADVRMIHIKKSKSFEIPFYFKNFDLAFSSSLEDFMNLLVDKYKGELKNRLDYKIREGNVYKEITNQAKYDDAYLIIMGTHGVSGFEERFIGSNAFKVVSNSLCPTITIRNGFLHKTLKNIVLPIDLSKETRQKVPFVTELASFFNATVHIAGVSETNDVELNKKITKYCSQVEEYIKEKGVTCSKTLLTGSNITELTIEYAIQIKAELIAIMTEQIKNTAFWLGPYAQQMVNHSAIPVLSIHSQSK